MPWPTLRLASLLMKTVPMTATKAVSVFFLAHGRGQNLCDSDCAHHSGVLLGVFIAIGMSRTRAQRHT